MAENRALDGCAHHLFIRAVSADAPAVNVTVETGMSQILTVGSDIKKAAVSNREVADVEPITPRQLMIIGKAPGNTNLIIWDATGQPTFFNLDVATHQHQQIVLQVKVAEVGRSALRDLGINFSSIGKKLGGASYAGGSFSAPAGSALAPGMTLGSDVTAALVQIPQNIDVMIRALDKKGLSKTLAEPNLVVKSGKKGSLLPARGYLLSRQLSAPAAEPQRPLLRSRRLV